LLESSCCTISFCVETYISGVAFGYVLISFSSQFSFCVFFFTSKAQAVVLREGYAGSAALCRVLVVVTVTSFLPSVRGMEFSFFDGGSVALL
jgi:hypothetical protein